MPQFTVTTPKGNELDITVDSRSRIAAATEAAERDGDTTYSGTYQVRQHGSKTANLEQTFTVGRDDHLSPAERVKIRRGEFPGVDELAATALAAFPADGSPVPFAAFAESLGADADQLFGALIQLKAQGRADITYGFGWHRTQLEAAARA